MFDGVSPGILQRARRIKLVALDVDGVLTDGSLLYGGKGEVLKRFNVKDGLGIRMLREQGYIVAVVTARGGPALRRRLKDLGITEVHEHCSDKSEALADIAQFAGVKLSHCAYVGDDLVDLPALRKVGLGISVADGHVVLRQAAHYVTQVGGGCGAVREVCELLLFASGRWETAIQTLLVPKARNFSVIIPARHDSKRLPGKPLRLLGDRPMLLHVCENAKRSGASSVLVATDDERIRHTVEDAGYEAVMTSSRHRSGTERLAEVLLRRHELRREVVVNLQGDEPLLGPECIARVGHALLKRPSADIATLAAPINSVSEWNNPNIVKVIVNRAGTAQYFSRAAIPFVRDPDLTGLGRLPPGLEPLRHVGIYAYRAEALLRTAVGRPVMSEKFEVLEQLRALWHGLSIVVEVVDGLPALSVDTEEDLMKVTELLSERAFASLPAVRQHGA